MLAANVTGAPACSTAVPGSFRPWPVNTMTAVRPDGSISPRSICCRSAASPVAEAGSTHTPSRLASRCQAARMSSSLTAVMMPPDSSSAAAYAARAGLRCLVLVPEGKIALGKLAACLAYGAEVISIAGSFDDGLRLVREICERQPIVLVNSVNPWRLEGQKTGAFEIVDQLGGVAPDWHCLPVGNAGNISAYWMGYQQYNRGLPQLLGGQAAGAAPIVLGRVVEKPETLATAIRIGNPARAA